MGIVILTAGLDAHIATGVTARYASKGLEVVHEAIRDCLWDRIQAIRPGIVLLRREGQSVDELLPLVRSIRSLPHQPAIVLVNQFSSEAHAVAAFRAGVADYFKEPVSDAQVFSRIDNLLEINRNYMVGDEDKLVAPEQKIVGKSLVMKEIKSHLARLAATKSTVLITGETGTGKELAAMMIHRLSRRCRGPFVCVNCAAIPDNLVESELFGHKRGAFTGAFVEQKGKFEQAMGGTLFLDEIGDMSTVSQAKILRSLESKRIIPLGGRMSKSLNVRFIAATNHEIEQLVMIGQFRPDLYYRLNVASVHLPPLRERKEDIPQLTMHAIAAMNRRFNRRVEGLTEEALQLMLKYHWPGNIRELFNLIESAFINLPPRKIKQIPLPAQFCKALGKTLTESLEERACIIATLRETNWNKSNAAQKLKWSRMTLYRKMAKYNIAMQEQQ